MFYLSWILSIKDNNNSQFFSLLSKSFAYMSSVPNPQIQQLIFSAHHHSLLLFIQNDKYRSPDECLEYLRDFYSTGLPYPPDSFDIIYHIISYAILSENSYLHLFAEVEIFCEELDALFPNQVAEEIVLCLMHSLSRLDLSSLSLFSHLRKHISFDTKAKLFTIMGNSIWQFLLANPPFMKMKHVFRITDFLPPISPPVSFILDFWDGPGFTNGVNLNQQISFPETVTLINLLSCEVSNRLTLIIQASGEEAFLVTLLLDSFSELLKKVKNVDHIFDLGATFLLCCSILPQFIRPKEANILMSPPFFHPSMTVFSYEKSDFEEYKKINTLRYYIIQILTRTKINIITDIFMKWIHEPLLFAEIVHRIIQSNLLSSLDFNDTNNSDRIKSLCHSLMISSLYYQKLHYSVDEDKIESIEIARTSILLLISSLFSVPSAFSFLFSNSEFDSFFFSFLFEVPLRSFVLSSLLSFLLLREQNEIPNFVIKILYEIFSICFSSFPEEKFVLLVSDILTTLNDSFIHVRSKADSFLSFIYLIIPSFDKVEKSQVMENYILKCIQFLSFVSHPKSITLAQYDSLSKAISIVFDKKNIPQTLIVKMIQLIAGDNLSSINPTFRICHPKAVRVLLGAILEDSKLLEIVKFIDSLTLFLHYNAIQLRHAKFDLFLIEIIRKQTDEKVVNSMLSLFKHIASVVSNISVVQNYISLLSPFEGRYYSNFQQNYILAMTKIINSSSKDPFASIPIINPTNAVEIIGLTKQDIENGFTFVFWILNDPSQSQYKPSCLYLQDSKMNTINAFITSSYIFSYQRVNSLNSTGKIDRLLPPNQWTFIALTYDFKSPSISYVFPTYGVNSLDPIEYIPMSFQPGPITCKIGGTTDNSVTSDCISRIATFGMFPPLDQDTLTVISQMGPRGIGNLPQQPLFFYTTDENNGILSLNEKFVMPNIKCQYNFDEIPLETNFTKILIDFCKCQILLPLYAQIDMTMKNGNTFTIEKVTNELIRNLFSDSRNAQISFYYAKGVEILSNLLKSCKETHIDYALYIQFYGIMQGITYLPLQEQVLKMILLDCELWLRADAENHIRILKHWDRTLFPTMMTSLTSTFRNILLVMRIYYWFSFTKEEREYIQCPDRCRGEELNITECRQLLSRIAIKVANEKFDKDDFLCLINHCLTCAELKQVTDLLLIFKSLALSDPSPLSNIDIDIVSFLHILLPREDNSLLIIILETLITCYYSNLVQKPPLQDQIRYIIEQLSPSRITPELFMMATESIKNGYFEMFQFCCWMSLNESIDSSLLSDLITNQFQASKKFITHVTWSFWPIVFCYSVDVKNDICFQLLLFLSLCDFSEWKNLFNMIHDVGIILNKKSDDMKALLLHSIAQILNSVNEFDDESVSSFFVLCRRFIFYRRRDEHSLAIESFYKNSPFNHENNNNEPFANLPKNEYFNRFNRNNDSSEIDNESSTDDFIPIDISDCPPPPSAPKSRRVIGSLSVSSLMIPRIPVVLNNMKPPIPQKEVNIHSITSIKEKIQCSQFQTDILQFALRFDDDCHWIDADLAKEVISIYQEIQLPQFLSLDLIICAFLMHECPEMVCDHIMQLEILNNVDLENTASSSNANNSTNSGTSNNLSISGSGSRFYHVGSFSTSAQPMQMIFPSNSFDNNDSSEFSNGYVFSGNSKVKVQKAIDLLNHHCQIAGFDFIIEPSVEPILSNNAFKCLEKASFSTDTDLVASAKKLFMLIKMEIDESPKHNINMFYIVLGDLVGESRTQILNGIESIKLKQRQYEKLWIKLWRSLSNEPSPWSYNLNNKPLYKRDCTVCRSFCPVKMKQNLKSLNKMTKVANLDEKKVKDLPPSLLQDVNISNSNSSTEVISNSLEFSNNGLFNVPCNIIKPKKKKSGKFALHNDRIEILTNEGKLIRISLNKLVRIYFRKYFNIPNSIEIFTMNSKSYFIQFPNHKSMPILKAISTMYLPSIRVLQLNSFYELFQKSEKTVSWVHKKISNFDYLMYLNIMSGRSFNDLNQYPIFPWVLKDYSSKSINLSDLSFFRDLKKPLGSNKLYNTSVSTMKSVYSYLFRIEPFSSLTIKKGINTLLKSIDDTFKTSIEENKELTPEFYFDFNFLVNSNNVGDSSDVLLPPWANGSRFSFIYMMRKALESDICSSMLNEWIDLIWGCKQHNYFDKSLTDSVWSNEDTKSVIKTENNFIENGQIPPQLFMSKHPMKILNIEEECPFTSPFTVHRIRAKNILLTRIDVVGDWQFKIVEISDNGSAITYSIDLSHHKYKSKQTGKRRCTNFILQSKSEPDDLSTMINSQPSSPLVNHAASSKIPSGKPTNSNVSLNFTDTSDDTDERKEIEIDIESPKPKTTAKPRLYDINSFSSINFKRRGSSNIPIVNSKSEIPKPKYNEDSIHKKININAITKEIKGLCDIDCNIFDHSNFASNFGSSKILFVSYQSNQLYSIDVSKNTVEKINMKNVTGVTTSNDYVAISKRDSVLDIYKGNLKNRLFSLPSYGDRINCCCLNSDFLTAVIGTRNCSLILYSLSEGEIVRVLQLDQARPQSVTITNSWGFIVCHATKIKENLIENYIFVFSINGEIIRKNKIEFNIVTWCMWSDTDGTDFMVVSDQNGKLFAFEVFESDKLIQIYQCDAKVVALCYLKDISSIVAVTTDGRIVFVPFSHSQ